MHSLTFRSSKIVYYGPHPCENCGAMIVRMGREFGGNAFNQPNGPIYPNTEWHIHVCDPKQIKNDSRSKFISNVPAGEGHRLLANGELNRANWQTVKWDPGLPTLDTLKAADIRTDSGAPPIPTREGTSSLIPPRTGQQP